MLHVCLSTRRTSSVEHLQEATCEAGSRLMCSWLKYGSNLAAMRPWLQRLTDDSDKHTQRLFSPDIRIQTVLAVERAASAPPPVGDAVYPALYAALHSAWGARIPSSPSLDRSSQRDGRHRSRLSSAREAERAASSIGRPQRSASRASGERELHSSASGIPRTASGALRSASMDRAAEGSGLPRRPSLRPEDSQEVRQCTSVLTAWCSHACNTR
jgi:hypothetical protein